MIQGCTRLSLVGALLLALVALPWSASARTTSTGDSTAPASDDVRAFGVALPHVPWDMTELTSLSGRLGRKPDLVMWYMAWAGRPAFPATQAAAVAATGATPVITWEPWDPAEGVDQPAYAMRRIVAGRHDRYLAAWGKQIKAYGKPVVIRFAHEMNGTWYPWAAGVNGNRASDYVAAWKRVHSVVTKQGATNIRWSWSPNVPYPGSTDLAALYPGDGWVDRVALDGYNWGGTLEGTRWQSFAEVFETGLTQLVQVAPSKPLFIGETASTTMNGDKAAWVRGMFETLASDPRVDGFTWFSFRKEQDWRIDSSPEVLEAFKTALASYR